MYLADVFTVSANLAGLPAISVPCGFSDAPVLPVGLQFVGAPFQEGRLLALSSAYEAVTDWTRRLPPAAAPATRAPVP
jgi:aspartyl-tRNA(Asn)/glutamyl-tRNA(Gln) amidotransferase subunit A